ncbi:MAG: hypothetical protein LBO74_08435 [Candidatus Symbiothrix sp.]|jgi:hypothetical protein|nr:hypothetical protein [Candidatus Symbiothrix sp.]
MKKFVFSIIALAGSLLFLAGSLKNCQNIKDDRDRLSNNQRALFEDATLYRTKDSLSAASVEKLTLAKNELEKYNSELVQTVKDLGIKVKRLESASTTIAQTEIDIVAPVKDTTIIVNAEPIPAKVFNWQDNWVSVSGIIQEEEISCHVQSIDTLIQIVHRIPKQFWFIKWGTKAIRQEILCKNPHSQIVYTEYIELKK